MNIIINIFISLTLLFVSGLSLLCIVFLKRRNELPKEIFWVLPSLGYVVTQFIFWLIYLIRENSIESFYFTLLIIFIFSIISILFRTRGVKAFVELIRSILPEKKDWLIYLVILLIIVISSWQYFLIGEGNYYHSGNEDFFDGINGGVAYLTNTPVNTMPIDFRYLWPIQYSSQAFLKILTGLGGVDVFLIQSILNLILTSLGVYWLVLVVFKGSRSVALFSSFWSVSANFYMTTFLNGHIGSMMYGSVAPLFIGLLILWIRKDLNSHWLIIIFMIFIFVHFTYPGPIYYLIIPALFLFLHERILLPKNFYGKLQDYLYMFKTTSFTSSIRTANWKRLFPVLLISLLIFATLIWFVYDFFEPRRVHALLRTNVSWKISLFKEMFMIFWGIYPSGSTGTLSALPLFISNEIINNISLAAAFLLTTIAFIAGIKCRLEKSKQYMFIYSLMFVAFFIIMRYFWGSPYYFYKFLYVNYFLVIIILFVWFGNFYKSSGLVLLKKLLLIFLIIVGSLNILWNIAIGIDYYSRPYNDKDRIDDFFKCTNRIDLSEAALDIPNWMQNMVFNYIIKERGIKLQSSKQSAKYLIQLKYFGTTFHNSISKNRMIYDNGLLKLIEKPNENIENIITLYEPEFFGNVNINWVGNEISSKKEILKYSLQQVQLFLLNNSPGKVYIDIYDIDILSLFDNALKKEGIPIGKYAFDSQYIINVKGEKSVLSNIVKGDILWEDDFLLVLSIPLHKKHSSTSSLNPTQLLNDGNLLSGINFNEMINAIKGKYQSIIFDYKNNDRINIHHSWMIFVFRYLQECFYLNGIRIVDSPNDAGLICSVDLSETKLETNLKPILTWSASKNLGNWGYLNISLSERLSHSKIDSTTVLNNEKFEKIFCMNSMGDYYLKLSNISDDAKFLRILLSPGPSINFHPFIFRIKSSNQQKEESFYINNPKSILDISLQEYRTKNYTSLELIFEGVDLVGHSLLPLDDRYLNYQIQAVELTDQIEFYSDYMIKALNNTTPSKFSRLYQLLNIEEKYSDLVESKDQKNILFGMGWYPFEEYDNEKFRWVGNSPAEVLINKKLFNNKNIVFELEQGPGNSNNPIPIDFFIENSIVKSDTLKGREKIILPLNCSENQSNSDFLLLKLIPHSKNTKIGTDPRVLNFRVFKISSN